ncbi:MAG: transposase [Deltaproteobacteria bacterium]|nr:transposase [Deltaproteobacteria bacterium]
MLSANLTERRYGPHHETLRAARKRQKTKEFRSQYAARAGIEATHEQAIRRCGLRQCRHIGQAKCASSMS